MRALLYVRKSADTAERGAVSLEAQEDRCRERAAALGATEAVLFSEGQGVSATTSLAYRDPSSRPALVALVAALGPGDVVVAWEVSRLGRDEVDAGLTLRAILDAGAHVVTLDGVDTRGGDQLGFGLRALLYAEETRRLGDRVRAGKRRQREAGQYLGGKPPYGFRRTETGHLEPVPEEAVVVRRMASRMLGGGSWRGLAVELNAEGVPTRSGGPWATSSVRGILTGPYVDGILGRDEVLRLRGRLSTRPGSGRPREAPLTGVVRCGLCGSGLVADKAQRATVYRCGARARGSCMGVTVSAGPLERAILLRFVAVVRSEDPELEAELAARLGAKVDPGPVVRRDVLVGELAELAERTRELGQAYASGALELAAFTAASGPLGRRTAELEAELAELAPPRADPSGLLAWAADSEGLEAMDAWEALDPSVRRDLLLVVFPEGVTVAPGKPGFRFSEDRLIFP